MHFTGFSNVSRGEIDDVRTAWMASLNNQSSKQEIKEGRRMANRRIESFFKFEEKNGRRRNCGHCRNVCVHSARKFLD